MPVWCGTPHLALVARIRLGSRTHGAHTSSGIAQCSAPKQRAVGARRASAGGRAHSVRSFPLSVSLCSSHCSVLPRCACARAHSCNSGLAGPLSPGPSPFPSLSRLGSRCPLAAAPEVRRGQVVGCGRAPAVFRSCQRPARFTPAGRSLRPALLAGLPLGARCWLLPARFAPSRCAFHAAAAARAFSACAQRRVCRFFIALGASACWLRLRSFGAPPVRRRLIVSAVRTAAQLLSRM